MYQGIPETERSPGRRLFELTTLQEICRELRRARDPVPLTFDLLTSLIGLTGARWGILWLKSPSNGKLLLAHQCGLERLTFRHLTLTPEWMDRLAVRGVPLPADGYGSGGGSEGTLFPPLPSEVIDLDPGLLLPLASGDRLNGLVLLGRNFLDRSLDPPLLELLGETAFLTSLVLQQLTDGIDLDPRDDISPIEDLRERHPALRAFAGESPVVRDLYHHLVTVAGTSCTVLLEGETGTGKQLAAEILHRLGPRKNAPFIEVDCGSIPENLIESELFGHSRGAFTGADRDRQGIFELADGGTLFLDEVGNIPWSVQGRLLRFLQERRFRPIGGTRNIEVDVRVIAATNSDLREAVRQERFREDLFYRLYVYPIRIPPLRERMEDIPVLADLFLQHCAEENGFPIPVPRPSFLKRLVEYGYPGNIRELRHVLERCVLRSGGGELEAGLLDDLETLQTPKERQEPPRPVTEPLAKTSHSSSLDPTFNVTRGGLGIWAVDVLRQHAFNIKSAAMTLEEQARKDPYQAPPITDRGTLTGYLQGESIRLFVAAGGDLDRVIEVLSGGDRHLAGTLYPRVRRYIDRALEAAWSTDENEKAYRAVRQRYDKLPSSYREVLRRIAEFALRNGPVNNPSTSPVPSGDREW